MLVVFPSTCFRRALSRRAGIRLLVLVGLLVVLPGRAAFGQFTVQAELFKPIPPQGATNWQAVAPSMPAEVAAALNAYETRPNLGTAIRVLKHFEVFAQDKTLRSKVFQHDNRLFQTLDAAKYELVIQAQKYMQYQGHEIGHALRVGSSGARFNEWKEWVERGSPLDDMPELDVEKQLSSDDDVSHFPTTEAASFEAAELLNSDKAIDAFRAVSELVITEYDVRDEAGNRIAPMHPVEAKIGFLSPTKAYDVLVLHGEPGAPPEPGYIKQLRAFINSQAFTQSNPEKYNGAFSVTQLERWAWEKGWVTTDVNNPLGSTLPYADPQVDPKYRGGQTSAPDFPASDLFGWMTNQHRQIFQTHAEDLARGELKYLRKYTERMIAAWNYLGIQPPPGYHDNLGAADLKTYNRTLLGLAHERSIDLLMGRLNTHIRSVDPTAVNEGGFHRELNQRITSDAEFARALNALAVAYANLDPDLQNTLDARLIARIEAATTTDDPNTFYAGELAKYLHAARDKANRAADDLRTQTEAFVYMREELSGQINEHLRELGGANLDEYLLKVATGDLFQSEMRLVWDETGGFVERPLTPEDVARDLRNIEMMAKHFGWGEPWMAEQVKLYFEGEPSIAVQILQKYHNLTSADKLKPYPVEYVDADGVRHTRYVQPSQLSEGMSLGLLAFKGAIKGIGTGAQAAWGYSGKFSDGRQLYQNLKAVFWDAPGTPEQQAKAYAQVLASTVGLSDLVEYFGAKPVPLLQSAGGTIGALSLAAADPFADGVAENITLALARDLIAVYMPNVAMALVFYDMGAWAWDKWTLYESRSNLVTLLLENGEWEVDTTGVTDPKLKGYYIYDGGGIKYLETNLKQLARMPVEGWEDGITLMKTGAKVKPREDLMEVAYRSGYPAKDPHLQTVVRAVKSVLNTAGGSWLGNVPEEKNWTAAWLRDDYGVLPAGKEDATTLARGHVQLAEPQGGGFFETGGSRWKDDVGDGVKRTFGFLVSEFWVRQQTMLEGPVLDGLIQEATKKKLQEVLKARDAITFLDQVEELDKRLAKLDSTVWHQLARSADPFSGPEYTPRADIPITEIFRQETSRERLELRNLDRALNDPDAPAFTTQGSGTLGASVLDPEEAKRQAQELLNKIVQVMQTTEDDYRKILAALDAGRKYIATAEDFDVTPYHAPLRGYHAEGLFSVAGVFGSSDATVIKNWQDGYRQEHDRVIVDIVKVLKETGLMDRRGVDSGFEPLDTFTEAATETLQSLHGLNEIEVQTASGHPYFPYLLRLRYQIHKLTLMLDGSEEITAEEIREAVGKMVKDRRSFSIDGDLEEAIGRRNALRELIDELEGEYHLLLESLLDLFETNLTLTAPDPLRLLAPVEAEATLAPRDDGLGLSEDEIAKAARRYRWTLIRRDQSVVATETTDEPAWKTYPRQADTYLLRVEVLGAAQIPLGEAQQALQVQPALFTGQLSVVGAWPEDARAKIYLDELYMGTAFESGAFEFEVDALPEAFLPRLGLVDEENETADGGDAAPEPLRSQARVEPETHAQQSEWVDASAEPGLLTLDEPLLLEFETGTTIPVTVVDASGAEIDDAEITVTSGDQSVATPDALVLRLREGDEIQARARRTDPAPGVEGQSDPVPFDPAAELASLRIELPFFDAEHLTVKGRFVSAPEADPPVQVQGGSLTGNLIEGEAVAEGGAFEFKNARAVRLEDGLELQAELAREDDRLIRPVQRPIRAPLARGTELDLGELPVEAFTVVLDPIPIEVTDRTGTSMPEAGTTVTVGGEVASRPGETYEGTWTFERRGEVVAVEARYAMPSGEPVRAATELALAQLRDLDQPSLDEPIRLDLPVFLPGRVDFVGGVAFEENAPEPLPDEVTLTFSSLSTTQTVDADVDFLFSVPEPVRADAALTISARAERDGQVYEGQKEVTTTRDQGAIRVGIIRLARSGRSRLVPDVTGLVLNAATQTLENLGFTVAAQEDPAPSDQAGMVTAQSLGPEDGPQPPGTLVTLTHDGTPEAEYVVPDLYGKTYDEARALLEAAGLTIGAPTGGDAAPSAELAHKVAAQSLAAGTQADAGTTVTVTLFAEHSALNAVPNVYGMTFEEARSVLAASGFAATGPVGGDPAHEQELEYRVAAQSVLAGTRQPEGTQVEITIYGAFSAPECDLLVQRGHAAFEAHQYQQALNAYYAARQRGCSGPIDQWIGDAQDAIDHVRQQEHCNRLVERGNAALRSGDITSARDAFLEALALDCPNPGLEDAIANTQMDQECASLIASGQAAYRSGQPRSALGYLRRAENLGCDLSRHTGLVNSVLTGIEEGVAQQTRESCRNMLADIRTYRQQGNVSAAGATQAAALAMGCDAGNVMEAGNTPTPSPPPADDPGEPIDPLDDIEVTQYNIEITLWDAECEDGDVITVFINGQAHLSNFMVKNEPHTFRVTLPSPNNEIEIYAVNGGTASPPGQTCDLTINSAAMSVSNATSGGRQSYQMRAKQSTRARILVR